MFKNLIRYVAIAILAVAAAGCSRVQTGEVGVRVGFDKQVQTQELMPGSFNQTLIGDVLHFAVKDVSATVEDLRPIASDNSTMKDFDLTVIYSVNPSSVAELYSTKSKAFHADRDGDIYLMYNWIKLSARNAVYEHARKYEALTMNDHRADLEAAIRGAIEQEMKNEKLEGALTISRVSISSILPADAIVQSANELVKAKNDKLRKEVEVQTASKEAERIAILNANKGAIEYMDAQSRQMMAQAIANGKVNTIVVPMDFKALGNIK